MPALDRLPPANAHIRPHPPFDDNPPMSGRPQSAKIILRDQPQTRVRQAASEWRNRFVDLPGRAHILNDSVLSVINLTGSVKSIDVVVSDTGFKGPVSGFAAAGSGTWQGTIGSTITFNWFVDPTNTQGADGTGTTPGTKIATFSNTAATVLESFSNGVTTGAVQRRRAGLSD